MKEKVIPDKEHVTRYCKPTQAPDGNIQATAFMLRKDEIHLSVNWLETLGLSNRVDEIEEIKNVFKKKMFTVKKDGRFAVLNVGITRETVLRESPDRRNLAFVHYPSALDPSHSGINNLRPNNQLIAELILETILETH